ncbi:hypothetical protein [Facklamia sp. P9177]|uniref:hypothetical protein n=1 Tax=Facklamia sp. P9177 TaxID=3421945 RepID=UPI003D17A0D9
MRTNARVTFLKGGVPTYDFEIGDYVEQEPIRETKACHLSTLGLDRSFSLFGDYKSEVKIIRLLQPYRKPFDLVEINGVPHKWVHNRLDHKVFYVAVDSVNEDG